MNFPLSVAINFMHCATPYFGKKTKAPQRARTQSDDSGQAKNMSHSQADIHLISKMRCQRVQHWFL